MTELSIIITGGGVDRLRRLVRALKYSLFRDQRQLELLDQTLESAEVAKTRVQPDRSSRTEIGSAQSTTSGSTLAA